MAFGSDLTGTILDRRYQITGLLGKGGMGHVYDAQHIALEQRVAVKVLHPRYAYEERFRERFLQEARAASKIKHRNVVEIKDFGETPDGSVYFVMEYLGGRDVGDELAQHGKLSWSRTRNILLQAASALHAAHAKQIIHRDIKPGNCFLIEAGGEVDVVKLLDFGIAKVGSDSHADAQGKGLTGTGEVFGTASYMSPEQVRSETLDARSDLYSLGIMAYEMLVGQVPFIGVNAIHVITQHLNTRPEPLRSLESGISAEVEALVLKMIAKAPRDRYASMGALEQALRAIPGEPIKKARRTRLWSSPGDLRALVEEKKASGARASVPVVASTPLDSDAGGMDSERTEMVRPATPARRGLGVKRTLMSVEQPSGPVVPQVPPVPQVPVTPQGPVAPQVSPLPQAAAPSFGALFEANGSGSHPNLQPPTGPTPLTPGARADGTNPPPPSTWPNAASTGPHGWVSDTGTETHPHSLEAVQAPGISGRLLLVVGLLVLLVGGGSAVGTMVFLSDRGVQPQEPGNSKLESKERPEPAMVESATLDPTVEEIAVEPKPVLEIDPTVEAPAPFPVVEPEVTTDEADQPLRDVEYATMGVIEDDDITIDDDDVDVVEPLASEPNKSTPPASVAPAVPLHQTERCVQLRAHAGTAFDERKWTELADLAKRKKCWPSSEQVVRRRMYVRALLELGRFDDCAAAAGRSTDPNTVQMVKICRKKVIP